MGYYTRFSGEIAISPPLPWGEIKNSPFAKSGNDCDYDVRFRVEEQETDQDDGTLIRKQAEAVVCTYEDEAKAYSITEHLQKLLDEHGAGRTFTGYIEAEGEEAGDLWRLAVRDGRAVRIKPQIVWPDA